MHQTMKLKIRSYFPIVCALICFSSMNDSHADAFVDPEKDVDTNYAVNIGEVDNQDLNTTIIYRNYKKSYKISEIIFLKKYCHKFGLKFIVANNIKLSIKLDLDDAYIPAFNRDYSHLNYKFKKKFLLIGSAHNINEIRIKEKQNVEVIFLSFFVLR